MWIMLKSCKKFPLSDHIPLNLVTTQKNILVPAFKTGTKQKQSARKCYHICSRVWFSSIFSWALQRSFSQLRLYFMGCSPLEWGGSALYETKKHLKCQRRACKMQTIPNVHEAIAIVYPNGNTSCFTWVIRFQIFWIKIVTFSIKRIYLSADCRICM